MFLGFIPGSIGETSTLAILIGAVILLVTGIASWRVMLSVFAGGIVMSLICNWCANPDIYPAAQLSPLEQICLGGFAFAAVFMATDPVTGGRTNTGHVPIRVNTSSVSWWVCWPSSSGYSTADTPKEPCWPYCL